MEEKHEIITPNFVSKPSTTAPISATYKHIAAKVEFNGIHLTVNTDFKMQDFTGLKMQFFTDLFLLSVVLDSLSFDMIFQ